MSNKSKIELLDFLFHLRTPLFSIRQVAKMTFESKKLCNNMPNEVVAWLKKWSPKVEIWLAEVLELSEEPKTEDRDWKEIIQHLIITLNGVEAAAIEANDIAFSSEHEDRDFIELIISSIGYIDEHYKAMRDLLPVLD
jgi:uncharacterized protein YacL (UPF0231 family)